MLPPQHKLAARIEVLRRVPLFRKLTKQEIEAIAAHAVTQSFPRGGIILRKGDPASTMLIVVQGKVRIGLSTIEGRELNLRVMGPGDVIGEVSLLDGQDRSADAYALEDCVMLNVEREHFTSMLRNSSDLCLRLMSVLCDKLRRATVSVEEALLLDLSGRLGCHLQRMAHEHGTATSEGIRIDVRLSQSELASMIGASREKVNRQLKLWERQGRILNRDGHIILI